MSDAGEAQAAEPRTARPTAPAPARPRTQAVSRRARISREDAQVVISRALEIQDRERAEPAEGLTMGQVADIAAQVGVEPAVLRRALTDVRLARAAEYEPSRTERILGPRVVAGATLLPTDEPTAWEATAAWMVDDEGMRLVGSQAGAQRWVKDKRILVEIRRGFGVDRAEGVLRDLKAVTVSTEADEEGTVVRLEADTSTIRQTVVGTVIGGSLAAVGIGIGVAGIVPDGAGLASDAVQFLSTFGLGSAAAVGTAAAVRQSWVGRVRQAVDDALRGISLATTRAPGTPHRPPQTGWRATVTRWLGADR